MAIITEDVDREPSPLNLINSCVSTLFSLTCSYSVCIGVDPNNLVRQILTQHLVLSMET